MRFARTVGPALVLLLAGCTRDPLERTVDVPTASRFAAWRAHVSAIPVRRIGVGSRRR
jgi:hypothetical protein